MRDVAVPRCGLVFKYHRWRELTSDERDEYHIDRRAALSLRVCRRCGARACVDEQGRTRLTR